MNRRIRELAEQAAQEVRVEHNNAYWIMQNETKEDYAWREKFAELIIQECARIARNADLEDVEGGDSAVLRAAGEQIEKHFGVEE